MSMTVTIFKGRQTTPEDYPMLVEWWKYYKFPAPAIEFLPDGGNCGLMVTDQYGRELCAGFIYETNSAVCWMELIVANPDMKDKGKRKEALCYLIENLAHLAKEWEYKWIFTSVSHPSLMERYKDCGFQVGSTGATEMIKQL